MSKSLEECTPDYGNWIEAYTIFHGLGVNVHGAISSSSKSVASIHMGRFLGDYY